MMRASDFRGKEITGLERGFWLQFGSINTRRRPFRLAEPIQEWSAGWSSRLWSISPRTQDILWSKSQRPKPSGHFWWRTWALRECTSLKGTPRGATNWSRLTNFGTLGRLVGWLVKATSCTLNSGGALMRNGCQKMRVPFHKDARLRFTWLLLA